MTRRALGMLVLAVIAARASAETPSSVLQSLPTNVQKDIKETRARCEQVADNLPSIDAGLVTFTISGKQAVLVDPVALCGDCYPGKTAATAVLAS